MLQIATGKLFYGPVGRENCLRGTLYTNAVFFSDAAIETAVGRVLPTSRSSAHPYVLVYELVERMEYEEPAAGVLFSSGIEPYLEDFSVLVSFALNCTCTSDVDLARRLTIGQPGLATRLSTQRLVSRFFDAEALCRAEELQFLERFSHKLIGLPRNIFLGVMRSLRTYVNGMHRVSDDLELAYTLLVASVESLAQDFDGHESDWESLDERKRDAIDKALAEIGPDLADGVRDTILKFEHVALARRFREFVAKYTLPSYFREVSNELQSLRLGRSDLDGVLRMAYQSRSKYIHQIQRLPDALTLGDGYAETVLEDREMHLTLQGLSRLMRNTIIEFVMSQSTIEHERYNYHRERSGIIQVRMAPQYWVGHSDGDITKAGRDKLEGFLQQLESICLQKSGATLTDLRNVLEAASVFAPSLKKSLRLPYLALHTLFNKTVKKHDSIEFTSTIIKLIDNELMQPSSESLVVYAVLQQVVPWALEKHEEVLQTYLRRRTSKNGLRFPRLFEAAIFLELAERFRCAGAFESCQSIVALAVENQPGHSILLELEKNLHAETTLCWRDIMLPNQESSSG